MEDYDIMKALEKNKQSSLPWLVGIIIGIGTLYILIAGGVLAIIKKVTTDINNQSTESIQLP